MKKLAVHQHRCKAVAAGVDWITSTASSRDARSELWLTGLRLLKASEREGERPSAWHANGYVGRKSAHVAMGSRDDSVCLQLSSFEAKDQWVECLGACENVSRLDLAVDTQFEPPVPSVSRQIYRDSGHVRPRNGRKPTRRLVLGGDGGSTVYIGARASAQFGRVYDKGVEQGTHRPGVWWRWEVELKGSHAWNTANCLRRLDDPRVMIMLSVNSWFLERTRHSYTSEDQRFTFVGSRQPSTVDRQISWLARGVRPTVHALLALGMRDRVLCALGLPPQSAVDAPGPATTTVECA